MAYIITYQNWLPYALMSDKRGFISRRFGDGHTGIDSVGNQLGNPVCAIFPAVVTSVRNDPAYGNVVEYTSQNRRVRIAYCHLAEASVRSGAVLPQNAKVGVEGNTGSLAKGKHLHSSLWIDGVLTDPETYLAGKKSLPLEGGGQGGGLRFSIGDKIRVNGLIAPSAYSSVGTITRSEVFTITNIYPGTNFPYQIGVVGFVREADAVPAGQSDTVSREEYDRLAAENASLKNELAAANAKIEAVRRAVL